MMRLTITIMMKISQNTQMTRIRSSIWSSRRKYNSFII